MEKRGNNLPLMNISTRDALGVIITESDNRHV
jgi:hypothetical protein